MSSTRSSARRLATAAVIAGGSVGLLAASATPALAAGTNSYISIAVYPADRYFDGVGTNTDKDTGSYYGEYSTGNYSTYVDTRTEQHRGGAIVSYDNGYANPQHTGERAPVSILPGDVFRVVRQSDGAILQESSYTGAPNLAASTCIGAQPFAGVRNAGGTVSEIALLRRVPRTVTPEGEYGPGQPYNTTSYETVAFAAPESVSGTSFSGTLPALPAGGDLLAVSEFRGSIANDVEASTYTSVTRPAAACPAPVVPPGNPPVVTPPAPVKDVVAPSLSKITAKSVGRAAFLRSGLKTTVTIDEAGTVVQALYLPNGKKVPASVRAAKKSTKKKLVLVAKGKKASKVAGKVSLTLKPSKAGKAALKKKKSYKLKLVTTVRDAAGNAKSKTTSITVKR